MLRISVIPLLATVIFGCGADPTRPADSDADALDVEPGDVGLDSGLPDEESNDRCSIGATVFNDTIVHELRFELGAEDWSAMIDEAVNSAEYGGPDKTYFNASLTYDGQAMASQIAIRLKGHSSLLIAAEQGRSFPFKVDFNRVDPEFELEGLTKLNLHPNYEGVTILNELLSYGAIRAFGIPTARVGIARVFVNDEDLGLYAMVEQMGGKFVRCHFDEPYGDLYKPEEPVGNLAWLGDSIAAYEPEIEFKWPDESVTNHASLLRMLDTVRGGQIAQFNEVLDVDEVLAYLAVNVGVGNFDYYATFGHNYYLYEESPGRFTMLPWDMNFSQTEMPDPCGFGRNTEDWPISHYLLADPEMVASYTGHLERFLAGPGSPLALNAELDRHLALLEPEIPSARLATFREEVGELRERIDQRVSAQLAAIGAGVTTCPVGTEEGGDGCDECIDANCSETIDACFNDEACACVAECLFDDEEEDVCLEECEEQAVPAGVSAIVECVFGLCEEQCE